MKILREPNKLVTKYMVPQQVMSGVTYVKSPYIIEDGGAVYNCLTNEMILVDDWEKDRSILIRRWYLVPEGFECAGIAYMLRQKNISRNSGPGSNLKRSYVIFTTTACNASCEYCFEKGAQIFTMSEDTAHNVADYIKRTRQNDRIKIKWFGGEPLVNKAAMNTICDDLRKDSIDYWCVISTNGDLFPKCTNDEILFWKPSVIQFTMDDTEAEYDRIKGLPKGAYGRLKDTIVRLGELLPKCRVSLRVHYNPDKSSDVCYRIIDDFKTYKNVQIYARLLYDKKSKEAYDELMKIEDYIIDQKKHDVFELPFHYGSHCMADNYRIACINPEGKLSPCEHYSYGEHIYGDIAYSAMNRGKLNKWAIRQKYLDKSCVNCPLYPTCNKIVMCPAEEACSDGYQYYQIETIKRALRKKVEELGYQSS